MSPYTQTWERAGLTQAFAPTLALVRIIAEEFSRATAAAHRYERLKRAGRGGSGCAADAARQVFVEFYADE